MKRAARLSLPLVSAAVALAVAGCSGGSGTTRAAASMTSTTGAATAASAPVLSTPTTPASPASAASPASPASLGADDLLTGMKSNMKAATSVRVKGGLTVSGQKVTLDLSLNAAGGAYGTVQAAQGELTVLRAGGKVYAQVTEDFVKQQNLPRDEAAWALGKYVPLGASDTQGFTELLDLKAFMTEIAGADMSGGTITGTTQVAGAAADIVSIADGSTMYVATGGRSLPLRLTGDAKTPGQIDFLGWNTDLHIPGIPAASQIIDPSQL